MMRAMTANHTIDCVASTRLFGQRTSTSTRRASLFGGVAVLMLIGSGCGKESTPAPAVVAQPSAAVVKRAAPPAAAAPGATSTSKTVATPTAAGAVANVKAAAPEAADAPKAQDPVAARAKKLFGDAPRSKVIVRELLPEGDTKLKAALADELALSKVAGTDPIVFFTAEWCQPCGVIKGLLTDNKVVQDKTAGGHFIVINITKWRSQAKHLIEGNVPDALPLLTRVDYDGKPIRNSRQTRLGLYSEHAAGDGLATLITGKQPAGDRPPPVNPDDIRSEIQVRSKNVNNGKTTVVMDLVLRNGENQRRWFVLPSHGPDPSALRFSGITRQAFAGDSGLVAHRYESDRPLTLVPVSAWGTVELKGWVAEVPPGETMVTFWKLLKATVDTKPLTFDKKVKQHIVVSDAGALKDLGTDTQRGRLLVEVGDAHALMLD